MFSCGLSRAETMETHLSKLEANRTALDDGHRTDGVHPGGRGRIPELWDLIRQGDEVRSLNGRRHLWDVKVGIRGTGREGWGGRLSED